MPVIDCRGSRLREIRIGKMTAKKHVKKRCNFFGVDFKALKKKIDITFQYDDSTTLYEQNEPSHDALAPPKKMI